MRYDVEFGDKYVIIELTNNEVIFGKLKNDDGKFIELESPWRADKKGKIIRGDVAFVSRKGIKRIREGTVDDIRDVAEGNWSLIPAFVVIFIQLIIAMIFFAPFFIF